MFRKCPDDTSVQKYQDGHRLEEILFYSLEAVFTKCDVNIRIRNAWTDMERLTIIWKSDHSDIYIYIYIYIVRE